MKAILYLILFWALIFLPGCKTPDPSDGSILLTANMTNSVFSTGETVTVSFTVENTGDDDIYLSNIPDANIRVVSFKRDGIPLLGRTVIVHYDEPLDIALEDSLSEADNAIPFQWASVEDGDLDEEAFETVIYHKDGIHEITFYDIALPGDYEIQLYYQIPEVPGIDPSPFTGKSNEVTISFTIN